MARKLTFRITLGGTLAALVMGGGLLFRSVADPAHAQGYNVDSFADAVDALPGDGRCQTFFEQCTLRAAIQEANAQPFPSRIVLVPGSYALGIQGDDDLGALGDLDVRQSVTIEGNGSAIYSNVLDRILEVHGAQVTISETTLQATSSYALDGGAIRNSSSGTLLFNDVTIQMSSTALYGGAIYNDGGTVTVRDSLLTGNAAGAGGGAIYNDGGTLTMLNTYLSDNSALGGGGGGLYSEDGYVTINNGSIIQNTVGLLGGGGIFTENDQITLNGTALYFNTSPGDGGGIWNESDLALVDASIHNNSSTGLGGGIYSPAGLFTSGSLVVTNSSIRANSAFEGGGVYNDGNAVIVGTTLSGNASAIGGGLVNDGEITVTNSTISANTATNSGGGIFTSAGGTHSGSMTVEASTLAFNASSDGGGIYDEGATEVGLSILAGNSGGSCSGSGTTASLGYNLEDTNTCGFASTGDLTNADPMLGPLANNSGPSQTHALLMGSDAIDAGGDCPPPSTDQRGALRPADGDADTSIACDIGAYEAGDSPFTPTPTLTGTPTPPPTTPDPIIKDTDGDGCADGEETGPNPMLGGMRNPKHFWDFYDVWTPFGQNNRIRDGSVSAQDVFAVIERFGSSGDPDMDPSALLDPPPAYHTSFDRGPVAGSDLWDLSAPDGSIAATDLFAMLAQFGHSCA